MNRALHLSGGLLAAALTLLCLCEAARGQQFLGKPMQVWRNDLAAQSATARRSAAFALGKIGKEAQDTVGDLTARLNDADEHVREAAAFAIGEICAAARSSNAEALKALCQHLQSDKNPLVRRSAAFAIGCMGQADDKDVRALLTAALKKDDNPAVRQNIAWALGRMGDDSINGLRLALKDSDLLVRRDAAKSVDLLSADAARAAVPELAACCLDKTDLELRKAVAIALVRLVSPADKAAQEPLLKLLKDTDPEVRRNAALAVGQIGGPPAKPAVPILLETLRKGDLPLKRQAALAFKNIGPDAGSAVPELRKALHEKDPELRHNAVLAIGGMQKAGEPAVPDLLELLTDRKEDLQVRTKSAVALQHIGFNPALTKAIPQLLRLILDPKEVGEVRFRTVWPVTRVYLYNKDDDQTVYKALLAVLSEPQNKDNKMLRYDCAYILGMFQQDKTSEKVLDVLSTYLKDTEIRLYKGTTGGGQGSGAETPKNTKTQSQERGEGDGRVMAVDALDRIGVERVSKRRDIVDQLRILNSDPTIAQDLRESLTKFMPQLEKRLKKK